MAYVSGNPKTKKALKAMVAEGKVTIFNPGLGTAPTDGIAFVEGPHYPAPHTFYAKVVMKDGVVVKVM